MINLFTNLFWECLREIKRIIKCSILRKRDSLIIRYLKSKINKTYNILTKKCREIQFKTILSDRQFEISIDNQIIVK